MSLFELKWTIFKHFTHYEFGSLKKKKVMNLDYFHLQEKKKKKEIELAINGQFSNTELWNLVPSKKNYEFGLFSFERKKERNRIGN